jgi:hypothetical protein
MAGKHDKLRAQLLDMLVSDRQFARAGGNPSAAVTASARIVDLLMERLAEETAAQPISALTIEYTYASICPLCREKQALGGPMSEADRLLPRKHISPWDLPDEIAAADEEAQQPKKPKQPPVEILPDNNLAAAREKRRQRPIVRRA